MKVWYSQFLSTAGRAPAGRGPTSPDLLGQGPITNLPLPKKLSRPPELAPTKIVL